MKDLDRLFSSSQSTLTHLSLKPAAKNTRGDISDENLSTLLHRVSSVTWLNLSAIDSKATNVHALLPHMHGLKTLTLEQNKLETVTSILFALHCRLVELKIGYMGPNEKLSSEVLVGFLNLQSLRELQRIRIHQGIRQEEARSRGAAWIAVCEERGIRVCD